MKTIRENLMERGVPEEEVFEALKRKLLWWPGLLLETARRDPYSPELVFVRDFADCKSSADVIDAWRDYRNNPLRRSSIFFRVLLTVPSLHRALKVFAKLQ